ncbi:AAA family ATPase [Thiothrix caldifontis]|nr:AAA family ATPase [Thiothrix caldifontis]
MLVDFPADDKALPSSLQDARKYINVVSALAADYQIRQTRTGQLKVLAELHDRLTDFQKLMKLTVAPVGSTFEPLTIKWLHMVSNEQEKLRQQSTHNELPNPYIAGNPLEVRDQQLFVGRSDILLAIEQFILNTDQRPSLLLYGRRRTGKSSTLLNLPRSRFEPVYIDCQDAKWHESDQAFCYNLAHDLFNVLYQSDSVRGLRQPQIEQFDKNAFTQLDQFLTQAQKIAEQRDKRILLAFDEYEELENSIINGDISEKVLGKLRNLIQHSKSIVVLVSGSHRFEELTRLNWANYLINTRTLELSYLDAESARELLTKPVPELHYEAGVVDEIIHITHCQPYLLQAVASELVNYLNSKQQTTATPDDLNTALEKTLVSASAYFSDTWRKDNSEAEQQVMRALATGKTESVLADAAFQPAIQSLIRKEIVEGTEGSYRLAVELFARWIVRNQV